MPITKCSYGKQNVAFTLIDRDQEPHEVHKFIASVMLTGPMAGVFAGDNSQLLPTGSFANAMFYMAAKHGQHGPAALVSALEQHFHQTCPELGAMVSLSAQPIANAVPSNLYCFWDDSQVQESSGCRRDVGGKQMWWHRVSGLDFVRTTGSQFAGFRSDRFTTMKNVSDRPHLPIFGWKAELSDLNTTGRLLGAALEAYAGDHPSPSAQHTMGQMGEAMLEQVPDLQRLTLRLDAYDYTAPDLSPFGIPTRKIYVPTGAPSTVEVIFAR